MTVAAIEQRAYLVNQRDKLAALTRLFEMEEMESILIFARTRVSTGELANALSVQGYPAEALNGDLSQDARERVLNRFKGGQSKVLVATDVAARGLDIDDISHVFNYDLPSDPESFVHRVGRTGRAGKNGIAISFVTPQERGRLRRIEQFARQKIALAELPTKSEIYASREALLLKKLEVWLQRDRCRREKELATEMVEAGYDPLDVAAAALKLARATENQRPIADVSVPTTTTRRDRSRRPNDDRNGNGSRNRQNRRNGAREKGMVRLVLNAGKSQGVRPGDVVSTIAYHADIPGSALGAIFIDRDSTLVDVPKTLVGQVLESADRYRIHRQAVTVERLN
jgi:ATP-dependent RNA helicase DeaD